MSNSITQLESYFIEVVSLSNRQDCEELFRDLYNSLEKIINKSAVDLDNLKVLEEDCKRTQIFQQNDDFKKMIDRVCFARRTELEKSSFSPEIQKNDSDNSLLIILLVILFLGGVLFIGLRFRKNYRVRKKLNRKFQIKKIW